MSFLRTLFMGDSKTLIQARERVLGMMDEQGKRDESLAEIQPFLDPIAERAIKTRQEYLEVGNESGVFELSETEMGYIKQQLKILFDREDEPVMYLGMEIKVV